MRGSSETMNRIVCLGGRDENIYQGGYRAAYDLERMREQNIGLLINCTGNLDFPDWWDQPGTPEVVRFVVTGWRVDRAIREGQLLPLFETIFRSADHCIFVRKQNVMVHCRAGAHRAGTVGSCFAMRYFGLNPRDAVAHVRRRRDVTSVCQDNMRILRQLYMELRPPPPLAAPAAPLVRLVPAARAAPEVRLVPAATPAAPAAPADGANGTWLVDLSESVFEEEEEEDAAAEPEAEAAPAATISKAAGRLAATTPKAAPAATTSKPAPPAAPAAAQQARLPLAEATGRLIFMSWNPGAGAKRLTEVIDTIGYHVVAVQELSLIHISEPTRPY